MPEPRQRPRRRLVRIALTVGGLIVGGWILYVGFLGLSESGVPPESALGVVPAGAQVLRQTTECASGGCWREFTIAPAPGQSAQDLAAQMGVIDEVDERGSLLDPRSIYRGSHASGAQLVVYVGYGPLFGLDLGL